MSGEELVLSMVCCNLEPPIYSDWTMKNNKENVKLEKPVDRALEGSSGDESKEVETEPPPVALRRKVSFADAFGLDLVSVKEYDNRDSSRLDAAGREGEEYYISCLFIVPVLHQDMEVRLQQQKLELERIELLPGSTTIRGIVRVLNLCFHKAVYIRVTLDGWQSHFDLLAEYMPGSSDGETDCFSFHLVLTPPFQVEGLRVEFCLRYESAVGTFWANNGGTNYIVFSFWPSIDSNVTTMFKAQILLMSLLPFWALNMVVTLLSMEGQKALRFHQKYLNLCFEDERRSCGFGMT
uniref:CBM21 domain-containing protein n=1 Tax=Cyprinus carpio TaxID=7962 RepID=A0A8C2E5G3_CYPCA